MQQVAFPAAFCDPAHESSIISIILLDHLCYDPSVTDMKEELRLEKKEKKV